MSAPSNKPQLPPKPPLPSSNDQSGSWLGTFLAILLFGGMLIALVLVSLGSILGPLLFLFLLLPAIALFHYLLWGWWLGKMIEEGDEDRGARDEESRNY